MTKNDSSVTDEEELKEEIQDKIDEADLSNKYLEDKASRGKSPDNMLISEKKTSDLTAKDLVRIKDNSSKTEETVRPPPNKDSMANVVGPDLNFQTNFSKAPKVEEVSKKMFDQNERALSNQEKIFKPKMQKYDRKQTLNYTHHNKIADDDCSPMKDKTTINTPTDFVSNTDNVIGDNKKRNLSDNTM